MPKYDVLFARFPYRRSEDPDVTDWLVQTVLAATADPRIGAVHHRRFDDTPITMTRNMAVKSAQKLGVDLLLMIDDDVSPDVGLHYPDHAYHGAKPFWPTALDFALQHAGPCVIAAPYCGPPDHENVYIFKPANFQSNHPNHDCRVEQFAREEAAGRGGVEEVFALPTGLILFDMRAFAGKPEPHFSYEWTDPSEAQKASTEDVFTTRNLALAGVPQYVAWDCWAGHWKKKLVGRPKPLTMDAVREQYRDAVARGQMFNERLCMVGEGES